MRVTDHTNFGVVRDGIQRSRGKMEGLQTQQATLKKLNRPSDDPVGAAKVLDVRTQKVNNEQFVANGKMAQSFLENSDTALSELSDLVVRAKEIAINQASGPSSSDSSRLGVAEEVTQMIQQAINVANRRIGDRYLFGGFKTNKPPVDSEGRYQGDRGQMMVEISQGVFMTTNLPGIEIFNSRPESSEDEFRLRGSDPRKQEETVRNRDLASLENPDHGTVNTNLFEELQNLRIGLLTGNLEGIRDTLERFDGIHANIVANRAKIGSRVQGLETAAESASRQTITNASLTQSLEDADMTQVVSDLAREETVFRSALSGAQKLLQPTLMDFLK